MKSPLSQSLIAERRRMALQAYRPQMGLRIKVPTPTIDAIERRELPLCKFGQGEYARGYTPEPINWRKMRRGLAFTAVCVLLGGTLLAAGYAVFQAMRGMGGAL